MEANQRTLIAEDGYVLCADNLVCGRIRCHIDFVYHYVCINGKMWSIHVSALCAICTVLVPLTVLNGKY